ncbi:DUF4173 domain-containing protein [Halalkalibacter kiskunsagensis]|uniref:DUF4173 domain-containing protein n=1 Tax=Halalkalibacter kiskunsagensis TaxID=1548599 RepID=A0ABV6KA19_9BACI
MNDLKRSTSKVLLLLSFVFGMLFQWLLIGTEPGASISLTITLFYLLYFSSMKHTKSTHFRMSLFVFLCVILISFSYTVFTNTALLGWSLLILPFLVAFHLVLLTSSTHMKWYQWAFITHVLSYFGYAFHYLSRYAAVGKRTLKQNMQPSMYNNLKMIFLGLVISVPLVMAVSVLLMSADEQFETFLSGFPRWLMTLQWGDNLFRVLFGLFVGLFTFGFIQSVTQPKYRLQDKKEPTSIKWNEILTVTVLVSLNLLYFLFVFVQFQYFFQGSVQEGLTYAQYARRGFFELVFVTLINWTVFLSVIHFVQTGSKKLKSVIKVLLSFMILSSGVMLLSAFIRLMLYEQEYGFTTTRFLVYSFMIFLGIIFMYSLVKVWLKKLSLARFYFFTAIVCFTILHCIHMDEIIAKQNIQRYDETGKVDIYYLNTLSGAGTLALIHLYEQDPTIPNLENLLQDKKRNLQQSHVKWQEFNIIERDARDQLEKLKLK